MAARRSGRAADTVSRVKPRTTGAPERPRAFRHVHALAALEAALDAVIAIDHRGHVLEFNPAAERLFGYGRAEAVGCTLAELIVPPASREAHRAGLARWTDEGPGPGAGSLLGRRIEVTAQNAAGEELPIELAIARLDVEGPPIFTASIRDLRDRHAAAERLQSVEERFRTLVEQLPLAVYIDAIDAGSSNIYSSPQIEPMLGYTTAEWLDEPDLFVQVLHPDDRERVLAAHARAHEEGALSLEYRLVARDGRIVWVQDEARTVLGPGGAEALQGYLLDVTERKAAEELLRHRAHHDELTDLPNRRLFGERVDAAIGSSRRRVAVLIVDLDDFKAVNDRLGHVDGDAVLLEAGSRLRDAVPDALTLARLGGDEFAVLVDTAAPEDDAVAVAEAVIEALRDPAAVDDMEVSVTASVGIAAGDDADLLFRHADLAVYRAKAGGKAQFVLYDASMDRALSGRLALIGELRRAQIEKDFVLHYQPVVGLETGEITGVEALVRWSNPARGLVSPDEFIPIAEESGVIVPLGRWVLREACAQLARWRESVNGAAGLKVGVNVSARQLQSGRFVQDVVEALEASKLEPGGLVLEITEATVVHDPHVAANLLGQLREMGVGLMLDDFGTGYSSLAVLDSLPFDGLKLDRSSVTRLEPAGGGVRMVRAIVDLGRTLGLSLVAEGIEGEYQLAELKRLGVLQGQGFLFARPLEPGDLADLLRARAISGRTAAA